MVDLDRQLTTLQGEIKGYFDRVEGNIKGIQKQVDAIDSSLGNGRRIGGGNSSSFRDILEKNEDVIRLMRDRKGRATLNLEGKDAAELFEQKTVISSSAVGYGSSGVLQIDRIPGIVPEARQELFVRDMLYSRPTSLPIIDFVKVNAPMTIASPVIEGAVKPENAVTFTTQSERVRTIATWIPASRQILDDFSELNGFIETSLGYYVSLEEELQILAGDGTGENLHGLIPQASAFKSSLLSGLQGWNRMDIIGRAIQQIASAKELKPTFAVMTPDDWWSIRLTKDGFGRYILGDPQIQVQPSLFGLTVVPTTSIAPGTFLVGSGSPIAAELRDRLEMQVDISTEYADFFVKNLVAVRGERRVALVVKRPGSFVSGSFSSSPA